MLSQQLSAAISGAPIRALDDFSRDIWKALSAGMLSDDEAQSLAELIHARRAKYREIPPQGCQGGSERVSGVSRRTWSYFPPKRPQRSPDKQRSLERRRTLAASGPLPPKLAARFTTGELAVLRIVADEVRGKGACFLSLQEIASRAGVGLTKTRMAIREASRLGLLTIEERRVPYRPNLTNVVRIISREWLGWIDRAKPGQGGGSTFTKPTENKGFQNSLYSNVKTIRMRKSSGRGKPK